MSLSDFRVSAQIAVSDMAAAREFYEGRLGLRAGDSPTDGARVYACGGGTALHVYASPEHAGRATATLARWEVEDLELTVAELSGLGVSCERYEQPVRTDARGIHDSGYGRVAWFRDPDGNTFALEQAGARVAGPAEH